MHNEEVRQTQEVPRRRQATTAVTAANAFGCATSPHPQPRANGSESTYHNIFAVDRLDSLALQVLYLPAHPADDLG